MAIMRKFITNANLIKVIEQLYSKSTSAVLYNGSLGECCRKTFGVRQGCILSSTLSSIFLERLGNDALEDHVVTVSTGGRNITNLRFADDVDGLDDKDELARLVWRLGGTYADYRM